MNINNELLAAYAEGNVSPEEREAVRLYLAKHPDAMESVLFAMEKEYDIEGHGTMRTDAYLQNLGKRIDEIGTTDLPMSSKPLRNDIAAQNTEDNLCAIRCEGIALRHFGIDLTDEALIEESTQEGWLQTSGTSFGDIGKLSEKHGLSVRQVTNGDKQMLLDSIQKGNIVIAYVDEGELTGDYIQERDEDRFIGKYPDHVVIVKAVDDENVTIIDSYTPQQLDTYPLPQFMDAWEDSHYFMVIVSRKNID